MIPRKISSASRVEISVFWNLGVPMTKAGNVSKYIQTA